MEDSNIPYSLASDFILHTSRSVFVTGKAGTGKTTLLKAVREATHKRCVVLAPTGVAAINASGSTIHSFFNIPPYGPFIPVNRNELPSGSIIDRRRLFQNVRLSEEKRELIIDLELIIIDEISMVRCDLLDVVDVMLRTFRKKHNLPFGGVQMVFIGDLFQLPPVVKDNDWTILSEFYTGPFFFNARALAEGPPLTIELTNVYRQRDQQFIDLLNHIRDNEVEEQDIRLLEERFDPDFHPPTGSEYITLTTHNYKADAINQAELNKLSSPLQLIKGKLQGEFPENAMPADLDLNLKVGAQIMFVRNDNDVEPRYFNGKIAVVSRIENGDVFVTFRESSTEMKVPRVEWSNMRYSYDREKEKIVEEKLGSFEQLPLRLAWAITIHKSQGLTFERAAIDIGDSFAPGQVYVALSRCVSLEGLILRSRFRPEAIHVDPRVQAFASGGADAQELLQHLEVEKKRRQEEVLINTFDFSKLPPAIEDFMSFLPGKKITDYRAAVDLGEQLKARASMIVDVARKFRDQISALLRTPDDNHSALIDRVRKAIGYFTSELTSGMLTPLNAQLDKRGPKTKRYTLRLRGLKAIVVRRLERLQQLRVGEELLSSGIVFPDLAKENRELNKPVRREKQPKGASQRETFELHRKGLTPASIAERRGLKLSTIMDHLTELVATGDVGLEAVVNSQKAEVIAKALKELEGESIGRVKYKLGDDYSYAEIRAVVGHQTLSKNAVGSP